MLIDRVMPTAVVTIQHTTYSIARQMVGVRVVKLDPSGNQLPNEPGVGLFYTYSDHLGNVSALSDESRSPTPSNKSPKLKFS